MMERDKTAILLLFYAFFFAVLIGVFVFMAWIVLVNITRYKMPWLQMKSSRIGSSPGLGFRPVLHLTSPLIWYKWNGDEMSYQAYVKEMDKFFENYRDFNPDEYEDCSRDILPRKRNKPCYFNVSLLDECAPPHYGYEQMDPCVYIKLNKIYDWSPDCYNETFNLPGEMPLYLRNYINNNTAGNVHEPYLVLLSVQRMASFWDTPVNIEMNTVWLSCNGYFPSDSQHMGAIDFFPGPGFKAVYFPYLGQEGYQSPLVAIKFRGPMRDTIITVSCRAWAHNINDGPLEGGPLDFQLMIGDKY